jgi:ABC-type branched-subunit amino acid transport system ATPase component
MLSVGRALMIDPQLILMDEPSEGLALVTVQHLQELILDLKREGLSILLIEQNLYSALAVGDRVYVRSPDRSCIRERPRSSRSKPSCCSGTLACNEDARRFTAANYRRLTLAVSR